MSRVKHKYHYLYKTTNLINNKYYYGIHSTSNLDDNYLGSGKYLRYSIRKYGKENFKREILEMFDNREALIQAEIDLITRVILEDKQCMNINFGGHAGSLDMVSVRDQDGNTFSVFNDDPRYLSGELVGVTKERITVKDKDGNIFKVNINDDRFLSGELVGITKGKVVVKDKDENILQVDVKDTRYLSGELVSILKDKTVVKDKDGNTMLVDKNDPRYLSGELTVIWKDRKHTDESKNKIKNAVKQRKIDGIIHSQYGRKYKWINNGIENKKIELHNLDEYLLNDWILGILPNIKQCGKNHSQYGRKYRWINNKIKNKRIELHNIDTYLNDGWILGKL